MQKSEYGAVWGPVLPAARRASGLRPSLARRGLCIVLMHTGYWHWHQWPGSD